MNLALRSHDQFQAFDICDILQVWSCILHTVGFPYVLIFSNSGDWSLHHYRLFPINSSLNIMLAILKTFIVIVVIGPSPLRNFFQLLHWVVPAFVERHYWHCLTPFSFCSRNVEQIEALPWYYANSLILSFIFLVWKNCLFSLIFRSN